MYIKEIGIALKKRFFLWTRRIHFLQNFEERLGRPKDREQKEFLESLLDQGLEPNFKPKSPCKCPKLAKIVDKQKAQLASKHKAPNSDSSQERQTTTNDNIPMTVRKMQAQAKKCSRQQQTHRKK